LELKVNLFLTVVFFLGLSLYYFNFKAQVSQETDFDYKTQDSLFLLSRSKIDSGNSGFKSEKNVDSDEELLDFSANNIQQLGKQQNQSNSDRININIADVKMLSMLPGIGNTTAEKIINLRNERSGFKSIQELKDVKGIGKSKFDKIKELIFIE